MRGLLLATTAALVFSSQMASADQRPVPCARGGDPRVGCFDYREDEVYKLWTTPEATLLIKLAEGEIVDAIVGADVCPQPVKGGPPINHDNCSIEAAARGNVVFVKFWRCVIPSPVQMSGKTAKGETRPYNFEFHTEPQICPEPGAAVAQPSKNRGIQAVSTAEAAPNDGAADVTTNLHYVTSRSALTVAAKTPIFYSAKFRYPDDDAAKRKESARDRAAREDKERVDRLLDQEVDFATHDPWRGDRNYQYKYRGSATLKPAWGWDNDYSTAFVFPAMQAGATLYRVMAPDNYACRDDDPSVEQEQLAHYDMNKDTMIITGTARVWRLRRGKDEVMDICDLNYNPVGSTPGTGTPSPWVQRVVRGSAGP